MPTPDTQQRQHHRTSPRLYSLDFFDAPDLMDPFGYGYVELRRERFERMLIAQDIPASGLDIGEYLTAHGLPNGCASAPWRSSPRVCHRKWLV
jgi:hypothetical protein